MTNTKFRKRALLSSVAMLLVALVALGSATFAWFVDDPNAKAIGINAKAQAATGLLIKTDSTSSYKKSADLGKQNGTAFDIMLAPAATYDASHYFYVKGTAHDNGAPAAGEKWKNMAVNNWTAGTAAGVYSENIWLKRTGTIDTTYDLELDNVYIKFTDHALADAATILLVDDSGAVKACFSPGATHKWTSEIAVGGENTTTPSGTGSAFDKTTYNSADGTDKQDATYTNVKVGQFTTANGGDVVHLMLYIYLDGANAAVYSDNAEDASNLITACNLYFHTTGMD